MRKGINYQYYVEGEDEKSLINTLKTELRCIVPGKVETYNVIQEKISVARMRTFSQNTIVVLVFDTDVEKTDVLDENIALLKKQSAVKEVLCIPQIKNLEDELAYSCNIKSATEITRSKSVREFKRDFNACKNLASRLQKCGFSMEKLWSRNAASGFQKYGNDAEKIKLK